jgi:hypothetical protein
VLGFAIVVALGVTAAGWALRERPNTSRSDLPGSPEVATADRIDVPSSSEMETT